MEQRVVTDVPLYKLIKDTVISDYSPFCCPTLYHYTSPEGLKGILETGKLWFSSADCLNDASEGQYIFDVLHTVTQDWKKKNLDKKELISFFEGIGEIDNNSLFQYGTKTQVVQKGMAFLCCFSKNRDSLPMWNYYVKNQKYQGYNISFSHYSLKYSSHPKFSLYEVIYDKTRQYDIVYSLFEKVLPYYYQSEEAKAYVVSAFHEELFRLKYVFKNPCFSHEEEVRAIIIAPEDLNTIKYRVGIDGSFVPYLECDYAETELEITMAPLMNSDRALESLTGFAKSLNKRVAIQKSNCPIRY